MSNTTDLTVKQRLQRAIAKPLSSDWPTELLRDALREIETLQKIAVCAVDEVRAKTNSDREPLERIARTLESIDERLRAAFEQGWG